MSIFHDERIDEKRFSNAEWEKSEGLYDLSGEEITDEYDVLA